jgi:hypothetical protein
MSDRDLQAPIAHIRRTVMAATSGGEDADAARARLDAAWPDVVGLCSTEPAVRTALRDLGPSLRATPTRLRGPTGSA